MKNQDEKQNPQKTANITDLLDGKETDSQSEFIESCAQEKNVKKTTTILACLFAVGVISIWLMIQKATPESATAQTAVEDVQIEIALAQLTGMKTEMFDKMDSMVNKFYEFSNFEQVDLDDLNRDPFQYALFGSQTAADNETLEQNILPDTLLRNQELKRKADALQLLSIMQTPQGNCCMIDDLLLYENDKIEDFTVSKIGEDFVQLKAGQFTTKLDLVLE